MSERRLLDTNVIVRYLVRDNLDQVAIARKLFHAAERGELTLVVLPEVLAECVFVLESFYGRARELVAEKLTVLVTTAGIELADVAIHLDALRRYGSSKMHFVDCTIAATAAAAGLAAATFDREYKKFGDVKVSVEP